MNVYIKPAAGAGSVVTNSVAEFKKKIVLLCATVNVDAAVNVVTVSKPVIAPIKPLVDVTGPENVVEAILIPHMRVVDMCLHVVSRNCQHTQLFSGNKEREPKPPSVN
jgi:hypothetical protein